MREPLRGTLGSRKCAGAAARAVETEPRCKRDAEAVVAWRVTAGQHSGHRSETEGSTCGGEGTPEDLAPSTLCRQEVPSKRHPCQDSARCSCPVSYARLTTIWWPESQPATRPDTALHTDAANGLHHKFKASSLPKREIVKITDCRCKSHFSTTLKGEESPGRWGAQC
ncbi:hypothetical protein AGIG_G13207 [Arapaima gigas]